MSTNCRVCIWTMKGHPAGTHRSQHSGRPIRWAQMSPIRWAQMSRNTGTMQSATPHFRTSRQTRSPGVFPLHAAGFPIHANELAVAAGVGIAVDAVQVAFVEPSVGHRHRTETDADALSPRGLGAVAGPLGRPIGLARDAAGPRQFGQLPNAAAFATVPASVPAVSSSLASMAQVCSTTAGSSDGLSRGTASESPEHPIVRETARAFVARWTLIGFLLHVRSDGDPQNRPISSINSWLVRSRANLRCQMSKQACCNSGQRVATASVTAVTR